MTVVTKEMLKDMRDAERMVLWRDHNGQGSLKLIFEDEIRNQKVETEKWYLIDTHLSDYSSDPESWGGKDTKKSCVLVDLSAGSSHSEFNTASRCLKEGDEISFEFRSTANGNIKNLNLYLESLHLKVRRESAKSSHRVMTFMIESNVFANNSAKMVGGSDMSGCDSPTFDPTDYKFVNRLDKVESVS